jgi:hypothetical protein
MTRQEFCNYLRTTLIPDLRESGSEATADDFETALKFIDNPVRQLIDNGLYFLPSPESKDYIEVASSLTVPANQTDMEDENGERLPEGSTVLFPN